MRMPWKSPFELEIAGRSPQDLRDVCRRRGFRLSGLRVRTNGDRLMARYVAADAASAPLLKATLVPHGGGTRIVGSIYWAAMYASDLIYVLFALVGGLGFVVFLVATHDWTPALILAPVVVTGGWLALSMRDTDDVRGGYEEWFRQSLVDSFGRK